jgi:hypothetical protein
VVFTESDVHVGELWMATVQDATDYDLVVQVTGEDPIAKSRQRVSLPVVGWDAVHKTTRSCE